MIFKVDFEKAYDSVRWDFLMEVLKKFGFGDRWCRWIQGCLVSSRGSVLVNGSPTPEFQFYKGLKQGDPLSPFLFLLIMESLHLSVQRVVDAGLRINSHKRKIMGISVSNDKVTQAAAKVGFNGEDGKIGKALSNLHSSTLLDIVKEIDSLNQQCMNFVGYIHKKMGNGLHTYFWDDIWKGDTALKILYPRIYALETNKNISVASKLGQNNLGLSLRRIPRGGVEQSQLEALREFSLI
ncbi:RNA-directed DNA polymerase, eukaryota, reverse transcriptase zinc-binding domain protein [Tanacetum coccineum]